MGYTLCYVRANLKDRLDGQGRFRSGSDIHETLSTLLLLPTGHRHWKVVSGH
jgi:hypothetical protein